MKDVKLSPKTYPIDYQFSCFQLFGYYFLVRDVIRLGSDKNEIKEYCANFMNTNSALTGIFEDHTQLMAFVNNYYKKPKIYAR